MILYRTIAALAAATLLGAPAAALADEARKESEREDRAQAARLAAAERAAEAKRLREERIAKCVIKPVMTDAEIDYCRYAAR